MSVCQLAIRLLRTRTSHLPACFNQISNAGQFIHFDSRRCRSEGQTQSKSAEKSHTGKELDVSRERPYAGLTTAQKVKEAGKDASYIGIIIAGIGVTGLMFYAVGRELFSKESPSGVYGQALKLCKTHDELLDTLGYPLKGYGETTRRGRRRYVSHHEYVVDGVNHMRMKFYVEGAFRKGTVHLEAKKNEKGKYVFRYIFVELDSYPHRTIVIEDNR